MSEDTISVISYKPTQNQSHIKIEDEQDKQKSNTKEDHVSYWHGLHIFTILGACALALSIQTLIPRHNSIIYQNYWYEVNVPVTINLFLNEVNTILILFMFTQKQSLLSIWLFLKLYFWSLLSWNVVYCACYIFWTIYLGYSHPMPFLGYFASVLTMIVRLAGLWFLLPQDLLADEIDRSKLKYFTIFSLCLVSGVTWKSMLTVIFTNLPDLFQWTFAFMVPAVKKLQVWFYSKFMNRIVDKDNEIGDVWLSMVINIQFAMYVLNWIRRAQLSTAVCMALVESLLHIRMSHQIAKQKKRVVLDPTDETSLIKNKSIVNLVMVETCEGLVPLVHVICFAMAYYGPNSSLIGNVGNNYWGYEKVDDPRQVFLVSFAMLTMTLVALLVNAIWLWIVAKIDIFQEFSRIFKNYWFFMAIGFANRFFVHFFANDINFGMDRTLRFEWITEEGKFQFIQNSTELTNEEKAFLLQP